MIDDVNCLLEVSLAWWKCQGVKNVLQSIYGFSSSKLVLGRNPKGLHDNFLALEGRITIEIVAQSLNAMHSARSVFIAAESSGNIRWAVHHNVITSGDKKYLTGDSLFYKRKNSEHWKGLGTVIGQDRKQVLSSMEVYMFMYIHVDQYLKK